MSLTNTTAGEKKQGVKLKKKYFSCKKLLYSNKKSLDSVTERHKSNKILNIYVDKNDSKLFKTVDYKNINKNILTDSINNDDVLTLNDYIQSALKNFIEKYKGNNKLIYINLNKIYSYINSLISSLTNKNKNRKNQEINDEKKDNILSVNLENSKKNKLKNNSNFLYELKIDELNKKIKELNQEIELLTVNEDNKKGIKLNKRYTLYGVLKRKISDLEDKLKLNEFKYLLCIKEQQKKISDLEKELKMKKIENDQNDVKDIRCFPNLIQYNYKDDINPKSIPLTKSILKNINSPKKKQYKKNYPKDYIKDSNLIITNSSSYNKNNHRIINTKNNFKTSYINNYKDRCSPKEHIVIKSEDFYKNRNFYPDDDMSIPIDMSSRTKRKSTGHEDDEQNHLKYKEYNVENIINKEKKYFISHPNLTIAGVSNRKNKFANGLPNKIFSFKFSKNLEKNAFFIFPSTLNETLVNLEKLRINKNYIDKDDVI